MKSFESVGLWFLPQDRDTQIGGTIKFSPDEGFVLSLSGSFQKGWGLQGADYPLIYGVVSESPYGNFFSLLGCFATHISFGMPGVSAEVIHANHGYAGRSFIESDAALFDVVSLSFSTLSAWLSRTGLKLGHQPGLNVSWAQPEQLSCRVASATISTGFGISVRGGPPSGRISFEEIPEFTVSGFGALTQDQIHSRFVWPLLALMTFASDGPPRFDRYQLSKEADVVGGSFQLDRLFAPSVKPVDPQPASSRDLLFTCDDLRGGFEPFMQKWFEFMEAHPRFCSVFFSYGYQQTGFLEVRFLLLMHAAECMLLDELSVNAEVLQPFTSAFQSLRRAESLVALPYGFAAFPNADQMAIPTLLAKLVSDHWSFVGKVVGTTCDAFLRALFATLNQVMHRDDQTSAALRGTNMYWLYARLAAAMKIIVLDRLGLDDAQIGAIVGRNAQMNHLTIIKYPWDTPTENG